MVFISPPLKSLNSVHTVVSLTLKFQYSLGKKINISSIKTIRCLLIFYLGENICLMSWHFVAGH